MLRLSTKSLARTGALFVGSLFIVSLGSCGACGQTSTPTSQTAAAKNPKIEPIDGFNYYIGGPTMVKDRYGRSRILEFNGRVLTPPSDGLVFGARDLDDGRYEFMTYVNGRLMTRIICKRDADGLLRFDEHEAYEGEYVSTRSTYVYDDVEELIRQEIKFFDPPTGELIKTEQIVRTYARPKSSAVNPGTSTTSTTSTTTLADSAEQAGKEE